MHTTAFLTTLLTTALAAPHNYARPTRDNGITVALISISPELQTQTVLRDGIVDKSPPVGSQGPYSQVSITVGPQASNKAIRCQLLDTAGTPIPARRNGNLDTTFADGDAGAWTFVTPDQLVSEIICDPSFKKAEPITPPTVNTTAPPSSSSPSDEIRVLLSNQATETGISFRLPNSGVREELEVKSTEMFKDVRIFSPAAVENSLRCQILDKAGDAVTAKRGENVDTTFSDGGKEEWGFVRPVMTTVGRIVCDPAFVKASA
ncbi:unnamed protein product [Periconia digitata]|uniref:Uncharacterized protein n=1 Tax=Periconia digitata TaxID=1303443 RepID=A0A9W4XQ40_9PLEO|nr:unnamed protein product [Periconia digitata]